MLKKKLYKALIAIPVMGLSIAIFTGCQTQAQAGSGKAISSEELSYRNTPLTVNTAPPPIEFPKAPPGQAKRLARSYENAPPLIPHSVKGLLPITKDNNACLGCHDPKVAKSVGATPQDTTVLNAMFLKQMPNHWLKIHSNQTIETLKHRKRLFFTKT